VFQKLTNREWIVARSADIGVEAASHDHTARIWRIFPAVRSLVEYDRAIMPRALTPAQRSRFFVEEYCGNSGPEGVSFASCSTALVIWRQVAAPL
jgi:hypothetical protein